MKIKYVLTTICLLASGQVHADLKQRYEEQLAAKVAGISNCKDNLDICLNFLATQHLSASDVVDVEIENGNVTYYSDPTGKVHQVTAPFPPPVFGDF